MMKRFLSALFALCFLVTSASAAGWFTYESGAWKSVTVPQTYQSGAWHPIVNGWTYQSGSWHLFFASLAVTAGNVSGIVNTNAGACANPVTNNPNTTITGGSGSYSYSWTFVSGSATPVPNNAAIQNPTWSGTLCTFSGGDVSADAVWNVLVTDTVTSSQVNTNISVHIEYNRP